MEISAFIPTPEGAAPVLLRTAGDVRGTVLLYHGLGADKETQRKEAVSLADRGFLVVTVDAVAHGARRQDHLQTLDALPGVVARSAGEIPAIVDGLQALLGERCGRFGVAGISMGGCIAFAVTDPRIEAVVPILATPRFAPQAAQLPPRALLVQNAGRDENVPPEASRSFVDHLRAQYPNGERLRYQEFAESSHFMREADWNQLWTDTIAWFERWIS